jgi:hypothetical protein
MLHCSLRPTQAVMLRTDFDFTCSAGDISRDIGSILGKLGITSERTGALLHMTAVRCRRTVGTRAASEGHGVLVIAELLDHSDTQSAGIYVEATPQILQRIDHAVALQLAPLAQAFAGTLIANETDALRAADPTSRICSPQTAGSLTPVGSCGKYGFCGLFAPLACYTCVNFQPWLDGPHSEVLDYLLAERDRLSRAADLRIASVNDRTILAVAEVVSLCSARKEANA